MVLILNPLSSQPDCESTLLIAITLIPMLSQLASKDSSPLPIEMALPHFYSYYWQVFTIIEVAILSMWTPKTPELKTYRVRAMEKRRTHATGPTSHRICSPSSFGWQVFAISIIISTKVL